MVPCRSLECGTIICQGEIISRKTIEACLDAPDSKAYRIICDGQKVGGVILKIDRATCHNELEIPFTDPEVTAKASDTAHGRQ